MSNRQIYRATWHDYRSRCIYMITISKRAETPPFALVEGSELVITPLGKNIQRCIFCFGKDEQDLRILQFIVMPDHIHFLVFVEGRLPEMLGYYIARWKIGVNEFCGLERVFETGFNDQILHQGRSLKVLINYIRDNPRRLLVRRAYPQYFQRVNDLRIGEGSYKAYGNMQLLGNPFREQVVVHRADSPATRSACLDRWLYTAANGGVLVSPFISPDEKAVRDRAEALDGKMIIITDKPMPERFKPAATDFDRCVAGRLLIISMPPQPGATMRQHCLAMNALALQIASL